MAVTPADLRVVLGIAEIPAPANEDAGDRTEREEINRRHMVIANRLHAVATSEVERYARGAPQDTRDEALLRMAGYLFADDPAAKVWRRFDLDEIVSLEPRAPGSALRLSGAAALLSPWRVRRAVAAVEATS